MKFINETDFLKQPKGIREMFLNWWKPEFGDLFLENYSDCDSMINIVGCVPINKKHFEDYNGDIHYKKELTIPLLTEGQLRQFIEDKTECKIEIEYDSETGYDIKIYNSNPYKLKFNFVDCGNDLLQVLWQVSCKIAEKTGGACN